MLSYNLSNQKYCLIKVNVDEDGTELNLSTTQYHDYIKYYNSSLVTGV